MSSRQCCEFILSNPNATEAEREIARIRLDELEAGARGQLYMRLDAAQSTPGVTMDKLQVTNPPTNIIDRTELIAKIKRQNPDFEAGDKSDAYLQGYADSMQPAGGPVYKNGSALNPGSHDPKLDEAEVRLRAGSIVAQHEARVRAATAWCTTDEQRADAIKRMDERDKREALHAQYRAERLEQTKLDASTDELSPVVRAQIRSIEASRRGFGKTNGNDPEAA